MDNSGGFKYNILGHVGLLKENHVFFVSLGITEILRFSGLSVCAEVVLLRRSFHGTLGCASAGGTGGTVEFCGLGDRTFEADFNS